MSNYDPGKNYTWSPDEKIEISGREFGMILNTVRSILHTEEAQRILFADRTNQMIDNIMARGVDSGIIREVKPQTNEDKKEDASGRGSSPLSKVP